AGRLPTVPALQTRRGTPSLENEGDAPAVRRRPDRAGAVAGVRVKYSVLVSVSRRSTSLLVAAVGGFLAHLAFPQASIWPLAIVGMALAMWTLTRDSARWAFLVATVWGVAHFLPLLWWAREPAGAIPWLALSIVQVLWMALAPLMYVWLRRVPARRNVQVVLVLPFAGASVAAEQLRQVWPCGGFPWVRMAFSQTDGPLV